MTRNAPILWHQERKKGGGAKFPGCRITKGPPKSPNNVTSTFLNTHLLPKDLRFEHGGSKFDSCPGRHLTSLRPCVVPVKKWANSVPLHRDGQMTLASVAPHCTTSYNCIPTNDKQTKA